MAAIFEIGAALSKRDNLRRDWRSVSFWMMCVAVVMSVPTLIAGYFTGRELFEPPATPPAIFTWHWRVAVTTTLCAVAVVAWRIKTRDQLSSKARAGLIAAILLTASLVSVTGHLGGSMVFRGAVARDARAIGELANRAANEQAENNEAGGRSRGRGRGGRNRARDNAQRNENAADSLRTTPTDKNVASNSSPVDAQLATQGRELFAKSNCQSCHRIGSEGGDNAPDLTHVGQRLPDIEWHIKHLQNPQSVRPDSTMPAYDRLPPDELKALSAYMASLK